MDQVMKQASKYTSILTKIGLSDIEAEVLIYLYKFGSSSAPAVIRYLSLDKSSVYTALLSLQQLDLIYTIGASRNQKFVAYDPERVNEIFAAKQQQLSQAKAGFSQLVTELNNLASTDSLQKRIKYYQGPGSFEKWAYDRLEAPKASLIRKLGSYVNQAKFVDNYLDYSKRIIAQRLTKEIKMLEIVDEASLKSKYNIRSIGKSDPALLKEVRVLPAQLNLDLSSSICTYADTVAFYQTETEHFFGIAIQDRFLKATIDSMIDLIATLAKKI